MWHFRGCFRVQKLVKNISLLFCDFASHGLSVVEISDTTRCEHSPPGSGDRDRVMVSRPGGTGKRVAEQQQRRNGTDQEFGSSTILTRVAVS